MPPDQQQTLLTQLAADAHTNVQQIKAGLAYNWQGWLARPDQLPPTGDWRFWLIMAGRGYGKTRVGAEEIRKAARRLEFPNLIGATADDARDIMIEGESGIMAVCPTDERPVYYPSKRQLHWPNGAKTLIFTADEPERLRGKQHMWLWADEAAAWRYPEAWDQAMFGLRLGPNPQAVVTTTPKPTPLIRDLIGNPHTVVTRGSTFDNIDNLAPAFADEIIRKYEGTRLGRQELLGELLEDQGLAYRFSESIHVVDPFDVPDSWDVFESMDYGTSEHSATAWLWYVVDHEGTILVVDEMYEAGLPSVTSPKALARRKVWSPNERPIVYADPSIFNPGQTSGRWGQPAVVKDEFADHGIHPVRALSNDRRAGYVRVAELLKIDESRRPPEWATHLRASSMSPRLFISSRCSNLIRQLAEAPLEEGEPGPYFGRFPGEAVSEKWESRHGHAHAALRYGLISRPKASKEPERLPDDPRARFLLEHDRRSESGSRRRYLSV